MTWKNFKRLSMTAIMTSAILAVSIAPIYAHNPPYADDIWFSDEDPDICFIDSELDKMKVNRYLNTTHYGSPFSDPTPLVKNEVDDARQIWNDAVSGLDMGNDGTNCADSYIEVGADDLGSSVIGQVSITNTTSTYTSATLDFNTKIHYEVESNACDALNDKDIEWTTIHEIGHALGLGHHAKYDLIAHPLGGDHSAMSDSCSKHYEQPTSHDISALEARYNK